MEVSTYDQENILNIFHFSSSDEPGSCGYCKVDGKKTRSSYSFGFSSDQISPEMYENLMFLNWRRCGEYMYKPDQVKSCCKLYSLRLDVDKFKIDKNQRRVMKNFRKYLAGIENTKNEVSIQNKIEENSNDKYLYEIITQFVKNSEESLISISGCKIENPELLDLKVYLNMNPKFGDYTSNLFITLFYYYTKESEKFSVEYKDLNSKQIFYTKLFEQFSNYVNNFNLNENWKLDLSAKTGHLNFYALGTIKDELIQLRKKRSESNKNTNKDNKTSETTNTSNYKLEYFSEIVNEPLIDISTMKHKYEIKLEPNDHFSNEKYEVYKKYQMAIHKDKESELSPDRYKNSWGSSNLKTRKLINNPNKNNLIPPKFGTYDLIHKINERIIAVGVLDILPHSVSSVYLYYDPEFAFLNPGVFSAIREIEYIKFLQEQVSNEIKYYCMGFYCHTCPKMRYKSQYSPSQLLCPVKYQWVDLESIIKILDDNISIQLTEQNKLEELDLNEGDIKDILSFLRMVYKNSEFGVLDFIENYIRKSSREVLAKCLRNFIMFVGKKNIKDFSLIIE